MEFTNTRRGGKRKKKRHTKKRLRDQVRVEFTSIKHTHRELFSQPIDTCARETLTNTTMQADAFWKNYTAAQEWQRRHGITWWRTRCMALEYENEILRNKIRSLTVHHNCYSKCTTPQANRCYKEINEDVRKETQSNPDDENLEFNMTEDMLSFFEKSERHRREQKQKYKTTLHKEEDIGANSIVDSAVNIRARREEADLLYGDASSKILAMEAALQATIDRHRDKVKPQYWPNIPLKP